MLKKLFSLFLSLGMMGVVWQTAPVQAQDLECECQQYVDAYTEASQAQQSLLEMVLPLSVEEALEYQSQITDAAIAVAEAVQNLAGCEERVQENADKCAETPLSDEELQYLVDNVGRVSFVGVSTVQELASELLQDLLIHEAEIATDLELSYEANAEIVRGYMLTEHQLEGALELSLQGLLDALEKALKEYLASLEMTMFAPDPAVPAPVPCPDCQPIQLELAAKNAEKANLEQDLTDKQQEEQDLLNEQSQFESDLQDAINAVPDCEVVADYQGVVFTGGAEAAGIMMGVHYHCMGETAVEAFLDAIAAFRQSHRSDTDIADDLNEVRGEITGLIVDLAVLDIDIILLEIDLQACLDARAELKCDDQGGVGGGTPGGGAGPTGTSGGGSRRKALPDQPLGPTELTAPAAELNLTQTTGVELALATDANRSAVDGFTTLVKASYPLRSLLPFTDLAGLSDEAKKAIETMGRLRILLGQGVSDPDDTKSRASAAKAPLKRAELAQIFFRMGKILPGYEVNLTGKQVFTDVPPSEWFGPAYEWMFVNGFYIQSRPGDTLNNAEAVTAFRRLVGMDPIVPSSAEVWYDQEFNTIAEFLPEGYSANPWDPATREFIAILAYKVLIQGGLTLE